MKRIALTGGMGSGKSHVRAVFAALGVPTIDADTLARDVVRARHAGVRRAWRNVSAAASSTPTATWTAGARRVVFAEPGKRHDLEAILHPAIKGAIDQWFATLDQIGAAVRDRRHPAALRGGARQGVRRGDRDRVHAAGAGEARSWRATTSTPRGPGPARRADAARREGEARELRRSDTNGSLVQTNAQVHKLCQQLRTR
jgi:dephospho-CoA kinase